VRRESGPAAVLVGWKRRWAARGKGKEGGRGGGPRRLLGRRGCWATAGKERREKEKRGRGLGNFLLFFLNLFKLTFQTFEIELFPKHSKIFKTFLKAFKTSHKQIIKPCIQIMMHKHLLLLDY
jgi:hypothetical protein